MWPCRRRSHAPAHHYFGGRQELYVAAPKGTAAQLEARPRLHEGVVSWTASVETAGLDRLEHGDMWRPALERMLVDQMPALLEVAARHDPQAGELPGKLILRSGAEGLSAREAVGHPHGQ